jgi:hypothetical protein
MSWRQFSDRSSLCPFGLQFEVQLIAQKGIAEIA